MRLAGLQCGRAVAALMVAVFHANVFLLPSKFYEGNDAGAIFNFGYAGVEFFFVLSGFIMMFVHRKDFDTPSRVGWFLRKRIIRIYPIYWVILTGLLLLYFMNPGSGPAHARDGNAILTSYLLVPTPDTGPIMRVAWTLQHEMLFYLIFSTFLFSMHLGLILSGAWMAGCLTVLIAGADLPYPFSFVFRSHNLLFLLGICVGMLIGSVSEFKARLCFWLGSLGFTFIGYLETVHDVALPETWSPLVYGLAAMLVILGLAEGKMGAPRWLAFLGDASYAIYLVHMPTMTIAAVAISHAGLQQVLSPLAMLFLITVLVSIVGALVHVFVEKPLMVAFRRLSHTPRSVMR